MAAGKLSAASLTKTTTFKIMSNTYTEEELVALRTQHRERVARCTRDLQARWKREKEEEEKRLAEEEELRKMEEEEAEE